MKKILLQLSMGLVLLALPSAKAAAEEANSPADVDWDPVMDAIIQVESEGNPRAVSGNSVGAMQITPILVKDCNDILRRRNSSKRFTLEDRYDVQKSKEMFLLIQSHYNPTNNLEKAIRMWNGGVNYSVAATNRYYQKVMRQMK